MEFIQYLFKKIDEGKITWTVLILKSSKMSSGTSKIPSIDSIQRTDVEISRACMFQVEPTL